MATLPSSSRLALGTAQFGLSYGIANAGGQMTLSEGAAVLSRAREAGVRTLDTAIAYGDSERTLGSLGVADWEIITKLPTMPDDARPVVDWVRGQLSASMSRLDTQRIHGLLLHRPAQLLAAGGRELYRALLDQRESGGVKKIGISIYGPDELDQLPASMKFDIVQAPMNILDMRMVRSGWADRLQETGCEFHARSIFLQGLLLMPPTGRPGRFDRWRSLWRTWDDWLKTTGLSALQACLLHALGTSCADKLVVGVDNVAHLSGIVSAMEGKLPPIPADLATDDVELLNPSLWPRA
ncbi:MAG TPA: aldo/keto reductase [Xanthomonadaceae bacterium]|jgi:aryl-alcohol dehydrogenase-like predicted oxidoreductase|nr:aldo/keto reductase [Xanthomonadaceae bacterium]